MEEDYVILKQYLLNLEYNAPTKPEEILTLEEDSEANQANEIALSIEYQKDSGLFYVDLTVNCNVVIPENISVFSLKATYRGVVVVNFSLPDEKIRECLNTLVPQELYESIRDVIYSVSMLSGWTPIEMEYYSLKNNLDNSHEINTNYQ